jgi:hypothetical protein
LRKFLSLPVMGTISGIATSGVQFGVLSRIMEPYRHRQVEKPRTSANPQDQRARLKIPCLFLCGGIDAFKDIQITDANAFKSTRLDRSLVSDLPDSTQVPRRK